MNTHTIECLSCVSSSVTSGWTHKNDTMWMSKQEELSSLFWWWNIVFLLTEKLNSNQITNYLYCILVQFTCVLHFKSVSDCLYVLLRVCVYDIRTFQLQMFNWYCLHTDKWWWSSFYSVRMLFFCIEWGKRNRKKYLVKCTMNSKEEYLYWHIDK